MHIDWKRIKDNDNWEEVLDVLILVLLGVLGLAFCFGFFFGTWWPSLVGIAVLLPIVFLRLYVSGIIYFDNKEGCDDPR